MKRWLLLSLGCLMFLSSCSFNTNTGRFVATSQQTRLPDVRERDQFNRTISLRDYAGEDYLLVFFYPEADTPG